MKKLFILFCIVSLNASAQPAFSLCADATLLRNFSPQQKFWSLGQTIQVNVQLLPKGMLYGWLSYYSPGRFINTFTAVGKSASVSPATAAYKVHANWRFRQVSVGWKQYLNAVDEYKSGLNFYSISGLGLLFAKAENTLASDIDTSQYSLLSVPMLANSAFKRLTLDVGAGAEYGLGAGISIFADLRTWIPITDYPSGLLHNNHDVPLPFTASIGLRLLFSLE